MWTFEKNGDSLIDNFTSFIETDLNSKGNSNEDFDQLCQKYNVTPCPFIKFSRDNELDKDVCKVINGNIDLSSWRAMLLACCCIGSKIKEIVIHNCQLTSKHLQDLATALKKMGTCNILKLQYLQLDNISDTNKMKEFQDAFILLLSDTSCLEYISLKGNNISDEFMKPIILTLAENFKLISLNLSFNCLTDITLTTLLQTLRLTTNIKYISMSSNQLLGDCLTALTSILLGTDVITSEEEARIKSIPKLIVDKNKNIKEINKKRKKSGLSDIMEIIPCLDCTIKKDGKVVIMNRTILKLDLSFNSTMNLDHIQRFVSSLTTFVDNTSTIAPAANINDNKMILDITKCLQEVLSDDVNINTNPQTWIQLLV